MEEEEERKCKKTPAWNRIFVGLGMLSIITAFIQTLLQIYALRISVQFRVIPYVWFFILSTWATIIYMGYSIRLLYLVRCRRCSDLSRFWWYFAVVVIIVNPAQSVWWYINNDYILVYVSVPASLFHFIFFVLVCRSMAPGRLKRKKKQEEEQNDDNNEIELGRRSTAL